MRFCVQTATSSPSYGHMNSNTGNQYEGSPQDYAMFQLPQFSKIQLLFKSRKGARFHQYNSSSFQMHKCPLTCSPSCQCLNCKGHSTSSMNNIYYNNWPGFMCQDHNVIMRHARESFMAPRNILAHQACPTHHWREKVR